MARAKRITPGNGGNPQIEVAKGSTMTVKRKPGRPRIEKPQVPNEKPALTMAATAGRQFDGNEDFPQYPGDPTQEMIDHNIRNYDYGHKTSQNDYLREWLPHRTDQLHILLTAEGRNNANPGNECESCGRIEAIWRCRQCFGRRMLCGKCLWREHQWQPFHRVEYWSDGFFHEGALWQVGVKLHLGHKGHVCPKASRPYEPTTEGRPAANSPADGIFQEDPGDPEQPEDEQEGDGNDDDDAVEEAPIDRDEQGPPKPGSHDSSRNPYISVIDITGVHYLALVPCHCDVADGDEQKLYLLLDLFPASFIRIRTVFTKAVLQDYRLSNLECKTSAYQYYQKIRRVTAPAFPKSVLNRYRELRRLSRQYRNLKLWKMHGKIYDDTPASTSPLSAQPTASTSESEPAAIPAVLEPAVPNVDTRASLALFCAACPQPGINLPDNWKEDKERYLYTRSLVADGNFKADQLTPKNPADDVHLTNGEAFMTASGPYNQHLRDAEKRAGRYVQEPTCHNHRANTDADKAAIGKRVRGVGAHACARHGCFCPGSVVDFTKGEKQMHMDWSLVEAIATTHMDEIVRLLHIYDVNCQFAIYLQDRVSDSPYMSFPELLNVISAIGLFHVHGHKDECLYRFASTYIPGVGIIDGEVLETLWAILNLTSPSTRGATIAHRTEVLDDHMGDSNWKKNINMADYIARRHKRAVLEAGEAGKYFAEVERKVGDKYREEWKLAVEQAEARREQDPTAMDMMKSKNEKPKSRKEIEAELGFKELGDRAKTGSAAWIAEGLSLEEQQLELRRFVRKFGKKPTTAQKLEILKKRRKLRTQMEKYITTAAGYLDAKTLHYLNDHDKIIMDVLEEEPDLENPEEPATSDPLAREVPEPEDVAITRADPERQQLPFPSALPPSFRNKLQPAALARLQGLIAVECELRQGQANDCLEEIRKALIQLSWHYKNDIRLNRTQATKTRAWDSVNLLRSHWRLKRQLYHINRFAILAAGINEEELARQYQFLELSDCRTTTTLETPNVPGQSSARLNWLWTGIGPITGNLARNNYEREFWRVNWLTARAVYNRWKEELKITRKEMEWTIRFFTYMGSLWVKRRDRLAYKSEGHAAYAEKRVRMWADLARAALIKQQKLLDDPILYTGG